MDHSDLERRGESQIMSDQRMPDHQPPPLGLLYPLALLRDPDDEKSLTALPADESTQERPSRRCVAEPLRVNRRGGFSTLLAGPTAPLAIPIDGRPQFRAAVTPNGDLPPRW